MPDKKSVTPVASIPCRTPDRARRKSVARSASTLLLPVALLVVAAGLSSPAVADSSCKTIQFERGASSATLSGTVGPDDDHCFRFTTGQGQRVNMDIESDHDNVAFRIVDLTDPMSTYTFRSHKKTYQFHVSQFFPSKLTESYKLTLSIR